MCSYFVRFCLKFIKFKSKFKFIKFHVVLLVGGWRLYEGRYLAASSCESLNSCLTRRIIQTHHNERLCQSILIWVTTEYR